MSMPAARLAAVRYGRPVGVMNDRVDCDKPTRRRRGVPSGPPCGVRFEQQGTRVRDQRGLCSRSQSRRVVCRGAHPDPAPGSFCRTALSTHVPYHPLQQLRGRRSSRRGPLRVHRHPQAVNVRPAGVDRFLVPWPVGELAADRALVADGEGEHCSTMLSARVRSSGARARGHVLELAQPSGTLAKWSRRWRWAHHGQRGAELVRCFGDEAGRW